VYVCQKLWKWLRVDKVIAINTVCSFFGPPCRSLPSQLLSYFSHFTIQLESKKAAQTVGVGSVAGKIKRAISRNELRVCAVAVSCRWTFCRRTDGCLTSSVKWRSGQSGRRCRRRTETIPTEHLVERVLRVHLLDVAHTSYVVTYLCTPLTKL